MIFREYSNMSTIKINEKECKCRGRKSFTQQPRILSATVSHKHLEEEALLPICKKCEGACYSELSTYELMKDVVNAYRRKQHLLTSEEMRQTREKYNMTQKMFADFLGVTSAKYSDWEIGTSIQEKAYDDLIRLKTGSSYMAQIMGYQQEVRFGDIGIYTGHKSLHKELLKNVMLYLIEQVKTSKLFLNKIMFYIDFKHFKHYGVSITGSCYVPLEYGPCPDNYQAIFADLVNEGRAKEGQHYRYSAKDTPDLSLISPQEKLTIDYVIDLAKADGGKNLFNLSHMESGFRLTSVGKPISYEWAKNLKI